MHAIILAGGKGVRLRPYTTRLPKPLVPIGEEYSILEIVLSQLAHCGFKRVTLAIGHLGGLIRSYIGDGNAGSGSKCFTSPATCVANGVGSNAVMRSMPHWPEMSLLQKTSS